MTNKEFVKRLSKAFEDDTMADVARRLGIPHATVRNYYQGRLPASEVLIKIANETGVSLTWLLTGDGDMYGGQLPPVGLGRFLEEKIGEMIDRKLMERTVEPVKDIGTVDAAPAFDVEAAVEKFSDPQLVMSEWFSHEGREYPTDYGIVFFRGWETFSDEDKIAAVNDAKRVLDRSLQ